MEPGERALNDPALAAQAGVVLGLAAGDYRLDPPLPEQLPVLVVVVAAVGDHTVGPPTRPADHAAHRRHSVDERDQLSHVVAVRAGESEGERDPLLVDEQVVSRWCLDPGRPLSTGLGPVSPAPFFACTWLESMIAPRPLDLACGPQPGQERLVQPLPHPKLVTTRPGGAST